MKIHEASNRSEQLKAAKEVYKQLTGYTLSWHMPPRWAARLKPAEIIDAAIAVFQDRNHRNPSGHDPLESGPALNKATKLGIKWDKNKLARSDRQYMKIKEDAPVNNAGGGEVAGIGVGADGEPGVDLRQPIGDLRKRRKRCTGKDAETAACEAGLAELTELTEAKEKATRIASGRGVDFWKVGDEVYRASTGAGLDIYGVPNGARWESSYAHWLRYRAVHSWAKDVTEITEDASDTFAGADVMDVDLERVLNAMAPKKPWERFSKYVGIDEVGEKIRLHARKNWKKNIILRDAKTGIMTYLRRRK